MNREAIRIAIKEAVESYVDITADDIERAMQGINVAYMVAEAVDEILPIKLQTLLDYSVSEIVEEIIDDIIDL